jgi:hypothetical protein
MKFCALPLCLAGLLLLNACSKKDDEPQTAATSCRIAQIVSDSTVARYYYSSDGSLQSRAGTATTAAAVAAADSVAYVYETDQVTVRKFNADRNITATSVFPLGNNGFASTQITTTPGGQSADTVFYTYSTDGYKTASVQRIWTLFSGKPVLSSTINIAYTVTNGNTTGYSRVSTTALGVVSRTTASFEFYTEKVAVKNVYGDYTFAGKSDQNLLKKSTYDVNGVVNSVAYTYHFNDKNLPDSVTGVYTNPGGTSNGKSRFYYDCQ